MKTKTTILIIVLALILVAGIVLYPKYHQPAALPVQSTDTQNTAPPLFAWNFKKASSLNPDGLPQTNVYLNATYQDGTVVSKKIDTADGSCNELPDADKGSLDHTSTIQCYAAGFGYTYRIIKGSDAYLVQRKAFEEATPGREPADYSYETVTEFSFSGK